MAAAAAGSKKTTRLILFQAVNLPPATPVAYLGERLNGADKTVSRPKRPRSSPPPLTKGD
jgi:hypothetical protein